MRRRTYIRCKIGRMNDILTLATKGLVRDQVIMVRETIKAICTTNPDIDPALFVEGIAKGGVAK